MKSQSGVLLAILGIVGLVAFAKKPTKAAAEPTPVEPAWDGHSATSSTISLVDAQARNKTRFLKSDSRVKMLLSEGWQIYPEAIEGTGNYPMPQPVSPIPVPEPQPSPTVPKPHYSLGARFDLTNPADRANADFGPWTIISVELRSAGYFYAIQSYYLKEPHTGQAVVLKDLSESTMAELFGWPVMAIWQVSGMAQYNVVTLSQEADMPKIPGREVGFALCRKQGGEIVTGPVAIGTPSRVDIPVVCPAGSRLFALAHTHPKLSNGEGGIAKLSAQDIRSAQRVGAEVACVATRTRINCFKIPRR